MSLPATPPTKPAVLGVSDARCARLTRGINASHWFAQAQRYENNHFQSYITLEDIELIKSMGFAHVRFSLNPLILLDEQSPAWLNPEYLGNVDAALDMILGQGLSVIVDLHPEDSFKLRLSASDDAVARFTTFWYALARHLRARDPEQVFLEVLNEPILPDAQRWGAIQEQLLVAMREGAPEHTLIATAHKWSSLPELLMLDPVADPNVVYNFHCYDPHIFTHQGATWGQKYWEYLEHLPYPSSPQALENMLPRIANEEARQAALQYGAQHWSAATIDAWVARGAAWAEQHNVRLTCNEFGVYRLKSAPEHRNAWIRDVRTALEKYNIGWTMWDYAGGFSVVTAKHNRREADPETAKALGLLQDRENGFSFSS
jgi:endoglucanase